MSNNHKKISLLSAALLSATCMVGSGWLFSAQRTVIQAGNWAFIAWIMAALVALAIGLCLSKVVSVYPVRGALTRSSALSHNSVFGMPFAFANWFGIVLVIPTEAFATTQYLSGVESFSWLVNGGSLSIYGHIFSLFILSLYFLVNFYGVTLLARVNNGITAFKVIVPTLTVIVFLVYSFTHGDANANILSSDIPNNDHYQFSDALKAIVAAGLIYSFNGFQIPVAFSSEIKNPTRNVPLAITLALAVILLLYMGLQYSFIQAMPHQYLIDKGGWMGLSFESPLLDLAGLLGLTYVGFLLVADSIVSPSACGYSYLGSSSRMLYAMSSEGQMPRYFSKLSSKVNISRRSLVFNFLLATLFLLTSDSWQALMVVVTGFHIIGYMAAPVSMGAVAHRTRFFGMIVFVILTLLLNTISEEKNISMGVVLVILMAIYGCIEYRRIGIESLLKSSLPFIVFTIVICSIDNYLAEGILGAIFYWIVTNKKYVAFCKSTAQDNVIVD